MVNANQKGKRGEREWAEFLRSHGISARRGQQFSGGGDSPDVVSSLPIHFEVKRVEALNLGNAVKQAMEDAGPKPWCVAHRKNNQPWLCTISADFLIELFQLLKKDDNVNQSKPEKENER